MDIASSQVPQRYVTQGGQQRLERVVSIVDRLSRPAAKTASEPVLSAATDGVRGRGLDAVVQLVMQGLELVLDLLLGPARHLTTVAPASRPGAKRDSATPAARTSTVVAVVPAIACVIEVD